MIQTFTLTPPAGDWTGYMIEAGSAAVLAPVAGRPRPEKGWPRAFTTAAECPDGATHYRISWVGIGGSRNMSAGDVQAFGEQVIERRYR